MTKYLTADWHIDHDKAMQFPGRVGITLKEWQDLLIDTTNTTVKKNDTLFLLGDFAFNPMSWRLKIKCKDIIFIKGNHDPSYARLRSVFGQTVYDSRCVKLCGVITYLLHYPCLTWPASHHGSYHCHGHMHDNRTDFWDNIPYLADRRSLDCCPESYKRHFGNFGIFSEEQIHSILSTKKGHDDVSWYRQKQGEYLNGIFTCNHCGKKNDQRDIKYTGPVIDSIKTEQND